MTIYSINGVGLAISPLGVQAVALPGLTPAWTVEYVDTSGVRQLTTINNDGSTSINIKQYANVTFDARGTRSIATGCGTAAGAAQRIGYGINYGEALGGNWATSGLPVDTDTGPPIFSRCYTTTGARTVSLYVRDPDGRESTITMTVNVAALGSVTDISSGGSWPTWASNTVYGLSSGNYTSRGTINTSGLTGIRIVKIGGGSNPVVGSFQPDARGRGAGAPITNRSKDIVLVNVDYSDFSAGLIGSDYCGSYGGRCAHFGAGENYPSKFAWENEAIVAASTVQAANIKTQRGTFVVNGGPIDGSGSLPNYAVIATGRSVNFAGTVIARTTGDTGGNPMRTYFDSTVFRHMQVYSTTNTFHHIKGSATTSIYTATPDASWPADDSFGDYATSRALYLANGAPGIGAYSPGPSYFWIVDCVFGGPGSVSPTFVATIGPQNDTVPANGLTGPWDGDNGYESPYTSGIENNTMLYNSSNSWLVGGRDMTISGNSQLSGAAANEGTNYSHPRVHPDYRGPYITTARPVHSALA